MFALFQKNALSQLHRYASFFLYKTYRHLNAEIPEYRANMFYAQLNRVSYFLLIFKLNNSH